LNVTTDRLVYRPGKDLINFTFTFQNMAKTDYPITLARTGEELTELTLVEERTGKQRVIRQAAIPPKAPKQWHALMRPGKIERVNKLLDPAEVDEGLKPGRYRVRGTFRYEIADRTKWKEGDFKLHSNEVVFTLSEWDEAKQGAWPAGNEAG